MAMMRKANVGDDSDTVKDWEDAISIESIDVLKLNLTLGPYIEHARKRGAREEL